MPDTTERSSPEDVERGSEPAGTDYEPSSDYCVRVPRTRKVLFWGAAAAAMALLTGGGLLVFGLFQGWGLALFWGMLAPVCVTAVLVCCVCLAIELFSDVSWRVNDAALQIVKRRRVTREIPYGEILSSVRVREKSGMRVLVTVIDGTWVEIGHLDARRARALDKVINARLAVGSRALSVANEASPACEVTTGRFVMWAGALFLIETGLLVTLAILLSWGWWFAGLWAWVILRAARVMPVVGYRYRVENGAILVFRRRELVRRCPAADVTKLITGFAGVCVVFAQEALSLELEGLLRNERAALCRTIVAQRDASVAPSVPMIVRRPGPLGLL